MLRALLTLLLSTGSSFGADLHSCTPAFHSQDGWLGADAAYSIPLSNEKSLWLFGDSFVGNKTQSERAGARMIGNSIGISSCKGNSFDIRYYWNDPYLKAPLPFFKADAPSVRYWPLDGMMYGGELYVFLSEVRNKSSGGAFGFEIIGVKMAKISNPLDEPSRWKIQYTPVFQGSGAIPGASVVLEKEALYLYTSSLQKFAHRIHLCRILLKNLENPEANLEYLAKDGKWKKGATGADELIVMPSGGAEMSVRFHPSFKKWIAVYSAGFPFKAVFSRSASSPEGPWSEEVPLFKIPEANAPPVSREKNPFCYAGKEHTEFEKTDQELLLSYACNAFDFKKTIQNNAIYYPRVVSISLKK
jgi:hypothetical protein